MLVGADQRKRPFIQLPDTGFVHFENRKRNVEVARGVLQSARIGSVRPQSQQREPRPQPVEQGDPLVDPVMGSPTAGRGAGSVNRGVVLGRDRSIGHNDRRTVVPGAQNDTDTGKLFLEDLQLLSEGGARLLALRRGILDGIGGCR